MNIHPHLFVRLPVPPLQRRFHASSFQKLPLASSSVLKIPSGLAPSRAGGLVPPIAEGLPTARPASGAPSAALRTTCAPLEPQLGGDRSHPDHLRKADRTP